MDSSGNLYGTTHVWRRHQRGHGFRAGSKTTGGECSRTITVLASFNGTDGAGPFGVLIMDNSGNLYGTTDGGGTSGDGTVFELPQGSSTIATLVNFNGSNGADPESSLVMDSSGNLYGTTDLGGAYGQGTVFELAGAVATPALRISGLPSSRRRRRPQTVTVTLQDAGGTTGTGFIGTVDFTSTEQTANVLANDMALDNGTLTFTGFVPQRKGRPSVTAAFFSSITGSEPPHS